MRSRIHRALSHSASLSWILFAWGAAEISERIEYIADKEAYVWQFLLSPIGGMFLIVVGLGSLALLIIWPDVKNKFGWLKWVKGLVGDNVHERLEAIENGNFGQHITVHRLRLEQYKTVGPKLEALLAEVQCYSKAVSSLSILEYEAKALLYRWDAFLRHHLASRSADHAFSVYNDSAGIGNNSRTDPDDVLAFIDLWGTDLQLHLRRCNGVVVGALKYPLWVGNSALLYEFTINKACKDLVALDMTSALHEHHEHLEKCLGDYAANFSDRVAKATMSETDQSLALMPASIAGVTRRV